MVVEIFQCYSTNNKGVLYGPSSRVDYQSEYEWLSPTKLKFHFYVYRLNYASSIGSIIYPDTAYIYLRYDGNLWSEAIFMIKDSTISHPNKLCNPTTDECYTTFCNQQYNINITNQKSIFRYTGIIDFNQTNIKDTLNKWGACMVDIGFRGNYDDVYNNITSNSSNKNNYFCYFSINRCFKWKIGDKSPIPRLFHTFNHMNWFDKGLQQMDFGSNTDNFDSVNYELELPKGGNYSYKSPYSKNYYIEGYCSGVEPCSARPKLNPPRGFYLSPLTGITTRYFNSSQFIPYPLFYIETKLFKKDSNKNMQQVALLSRAQTTFVFNDVNGNGKYVTPDKKLNTRVEIENLPLYRYPCEEVADTLSFNMRDTLAINQTAKDTIDYNFINTLPSSTIAINTKASNLVEAKIQWTAPANSHLKNPYIFNVYATEVRCNKNKREVFRSVEYNVIPTPRYTITIDTTKCGFIKFKVNIATITDFSYQWQISNGTSTYTSSKWSDSIAINKKGKWQIKLSVKNIEYGCQANSTDSIIINNLQLLANINAAKTVFCPLDSLPLNSLIKNNEGAVQYQWAKGNKIIGNANSISLSQAGSIKLTTTDARNCKAHDSISIKQYSSIVFSPIADTTFCHKQPITLKSQQQNINDTALWLHNQSQANNQVLSQAANYIIQYKDSNNCSAMDTFTLSEIKDYYSQIQVQDSVCKHSTQILKVEKNNLYAFGSQQWLNNGTLIAANTDSINYKFTAPTQIILNTQLTHQAKQCLFADTFNIAIYAKPNYSLQFIKKDTCLNGNLIAIKIVSNEAFKNQTINWGNGNIENFTNQAQQSYATSGKYTLQGILHTTQGCLDTFTQSVNILPSPNANFSVTDTAFCLGKSIVASVNTQPANAQQIILWGNGNINAGVSNSNYNYLYSNTGNYTIKLLATLNNNCVDTAIKTIIVYPKPNTQIQASSLCLGDSSFYQYSEANNLPLIGQQWFENGIDISLQKEIKLFNSALRTFTIALKTISNYGCLNIENKTIKIVEKPKAQYTHTRIGRTANGIELYFVNESKNSNAWLWRFGSNDSSIIQNPKYTYADTGFKTIILIANNQNTCYDTLKQIIPVLDFIEFYFPTAFSPNNNGLNDGFGLAFNQHILAKDYHIEIYNHWGEKLFETNNKTEQWLPANGTLGVYIYKAQVRDIYNVLHEYKGVVELLR